jgi:pimeloyl-ACP methyl ester carboxylesterase
MRPLDLNVQHHQASVNGTRLHFVELGQGSGPPVLLLHGFPETWWSWRHQLRPLAEAGHRVLAVDLRGYGDSDPTPPYDLDTTTADLLALLDHLGLARVHLVGHDWGGALSWCFAARHPERCASLCVLNCPHPEAFLKAVTRHPGQMLKSWYMLFFQLPWLPEASLRQDGGGGVVRLLKAMALDRENFSREELAPFAEAVCRPGRASAMVGWYRDQRRLLSAGRLRLPAIRPRARLIWGLEDRALHFEALVPGTQALVPQLEVKTLPGVGHFVQSERPGEVNALLTEFLAQAGP